MSLIPFTMVQATPVETGEKYLPFVDCWSLAFTGHTNIEKCFNKPSPQLTYDEVCFKRIYDAIKLTIEKFIASNKNGFPIKIIVGMARGVDEIAGIVAMDMGLDIICCVPHSLSWHYNRNDNKGSELKRVQAIYYDRFFAYPKAQWFAIKKNYSGGWPFANFARNAFMVDIANKVVSLKCYNSTGTDHCIKYATKMGKYAGNINL